MAEISPQTGDWPTPFIKNQRVTILGVRDTRSPSHLLNTVAVVWKPPNEEASEWIHWVPVKRVGFPLAWSTVSQTSTGTWHTGYLVKMQILVLRVGSVPEICISDQMSVTLLIRGPRSEQPSHIVHSENVLPCCVQGVSNNTEAQRTETGYWFIRKMAVGLVLGLYPSDLDSSKIHPALHPLEEPRFPSPEHHLPFFTFKLGCIRSPLPKWTDGSGCGAAVHTARQSLLHLTASPFPASAWRALMAPT